MVTVTYKAAVTTFSKIVISLILNDSKIYLQKINNNCDDYSINKHVKCNTGNRASPIKQENLDIVLKFKTKQTH